VIKPGTLCILLAPAYNVGRVVEVTGPACNTTGVSARDGKMRTAFAYPVKMAVPMPNPFTGRATNWWAEPPLLRPLNDPDNAPADPAYTKRREHA